MDDQQIIEIFSDTLDVIDGDQLTVEAAAEFYKKIKAKGFSVSYTPNVLPDPKDMARRLIREIAYANGAVDRFNPENEALYPEEWVNRIAITSGVFFGKYPYLWNDDDIDTITDGFIEDIERLYFDKEYFKQFHQSLNDYFNRED